MSEQSDRSERIKKEHDHQRQESFGTRIRSSSGVGHFSQGFGFPYKAVGNPRRTLRQFTGLFVSVVLIWIVVDAVGYGLQPPGTRDRVKRSPIRQVSYTLTEIVIDAKNMAWDGEVEGRKTAVPNEYAAPKGDAQP